MCLEYVMNVDYNVGAKRMSSGRLFQATGDSARLPSCSLVLGKNF